MSRSASASHSSAISSGPVIARAEVPRTSLSVSRFVSAVCSPCCMPRSLRPNSMRAKPPAGPPANPSGDVTAQYAAHKQPRRAHLALSGQHSDPLRHASTPTLTKPPQRPKGAGWHEAIVRTVSGYFCAVALLGAVAIAGCGSSNPTASAASCLRIVLDNARATSSCQYARTVTVSPGSGAGLSNKTLTSTAAGRVTCIRQAGNEYVCQASGPGVSYQVTYDGTHIAYTQQ